jgi:predicted ArsR family transcriptional regulator
MKQSEVSTPPVPELQGRRELILQMLRSAKSPLSIASIAEQLGVHPNTVRFHLDVLIDAGRVERLLGDASGPGRPPVLYRVSRSMDRSGPTNYRLLAAILTTHLTASSTDPTGEAIKLGRAWAPSLIDTSRRRGAETRAGALSRLVGVLAELGFQPESIQEPRATQVRIRHCPFLDLVEDHADVICPLHLGLMQGATAAMKTSITVDRLDPFVEPDLCIAHVTKVRS